MATWIIPIIRTLGLYIQLGNKPSQSPRAEPEGTPEASGYILTYILNQVTIQILLISKHLISSITHPGEQYNIAFAAAVIFSSIAQSELLKVENMHMRPRRSAIRVRRTL